MLCVSLFVYLAIYSRGLPTTERSKVLGIFSGVALCGGLSLLLYYDLLFGGLTDYFAALKVRSAARSMAAGVYSVGAWCRNLLQSYGPWLCASALLVVASLAGGFKTMRLTARKNSAVVGLLCVSGFILLENVVVFEQSKMLTALPS